MTVETRSRISSSRSKPSVAKTRRLAKAFVENRNSNPNSNRTPSTNYGRPGCKKAVWEKGTPIPKLDPRKWRLCAMGKKIRYTDGWDIDHILPKSLGGSDEIENLQPLHASLNRSIGNSLENKPAVKRIWNMALKIKVRKYPSTYGNNANQKHPGFRLNSSSIGKTFWVKQCPISRVPKHATVLAYDREEKWVDVLWIFANYTQRLFLDESLFEPIQEGRPRRF